MLKKEIIVAAVLIVSGLGLFVTNMGDTFSGRSLSDAFSKLDNFPRFSLGGVFPKTEEEILWDKK